MGNRGVVTYGSETSDPSTDNNDLERALLAVLHVGCATLLNSEKVVAASFSDSEGNDSRAAAAAAVAP
jgi:hypothetical protein